MDRMILVGIAAAFAFVGILVLRRNPRVAVVLWSLVLCFVPVWLGVSVGLYLLPTTAVGALIVISFLPGTRFAFGAIDWVVALLTVISTVAMLTGNVTLANGTTVLLQWTLGYLLGRLMSARVELTVIYTILALSMSVVALLAIVEFFTHWNPFVLIRSDSALYTLWGGLRDRGGVTRAEGAFGSSIALGTSIAMTIPMAIAARLPFALRMVMLAAMLAGVVLTFSRTAMICAVIALIASVLLLRDYVSGRARIGLAISGFVVAAAIAPLLLTTLSDAGDEATNSAAYRGDLLSLVPQMAPIGLTPDAYRSPDGTVYYGEFQSIDSALIYLGLNQGLIPLGLAILLLAAAVITVLFFRRTPAMIALVSQIPALITVALITQYGMFFWVVAGLAVSSLRRTPPDHPQNEDLPDLVSTHKLAQVPR